MNGVAIVGSHQGCYLSDALVDNRVWHFGKALLHLVKELLQPKLCGFVVVHLGQKTIQSGWVEDISLTKDENKRKGSYLREDRLRHHKA